MAGINQTPNADRVHIGFFGKRNAGKSSVVNAVTGQKLSIVSDVKGTTTDPVSKAMELLPVGPVVIIDTPGIDDEGLVGELRVRRARQILNKTDVAVLIIDGAAGKSQADDEIIKLFEEKSLPYIIVYNKSDLKEYENLKENEISVSALTGANVNDLKERIAKLAKTEENEKRIIGVFLKPSDIVVLVTPIDGSAPKGRMILPQVQTIRDILDGNAMCIVTQTEQLKDALDSLKEPPKMVVTDSQAFSIVKDIVPESVPLTSFSILFANYKGVLKTAAKGAASVEKLKDGDTVLVSEGCTHHRQCEDIGTVKLPNWIKKHTGKSINFEFTSGGEFPDDLSKYSLIVHCGGCMLNEREVLYRQKCAQDQGVPFTNYGTLIAYMNGILKRSAEIFPDITI
ncbi:MAG: [FeFe] hydrogenase H-cluster maturation GTPase HydF [Eubacterium sp.]|nr:[FeFe] hydrogenase H-cluster maturation GTPase HydF [Eubacterium sp.]